MLTELLTNILGIFVHFGIALKEKKPAIVDLQAFDVF